MTQAPPEVWQEWANAVGVLQKGGIPAEQLRAALIEQYGPDADRVVPPAPEPGPDLPIYGAQTSPTGIAQPSEAEAFERQAVQIERSLAEEEKKSGGGFLGKLKSAAGAVLDKAGDVLESPPVAGALDVVQSVVQPIEETAINVGEAILLPPIGPTAQRQREAQDTLLQAAKTTVTEGPRAAGAYLQRENEERPLWEQIVLGTAATLPLPILGIGSKPLKIFEAGTAARGLAQGARAADQASLVAARGAAEAAQAAPDLGVLGRVDDIAQEIVPTAARTMPGPGAAAADVVDIPLTSALKSVDEISADIQAATHPTTLGKVPIVKDIVRAINPSALVADPPAALVSDIARYYGLGQDEAASLTRKLQADLLAHTRAGSRGDALVSAVEEMIDKEARKAGFRVKDGLLNVKSRTGLAPTVGEVFENPSQFNLTARQRRLVDDVQSLLEDELRVEKARGVEVAELYSEEGRYFPRSVRAVDDIERTRAPIAQMPGVRQGFQQGRYYETMAEGMANGVRYSDHIGAAVGLRLRSGLKTVFDKDLQGLVSPLLRGVSEETPRRFGEAGTRFPLFGGRVGPESVMNLLNEHFTRRPPSSIFSIPEVVNNLMRPLILAGDVSYTGLQLLSTAFTRPASFVKAVALSLDEILTNGRLGQAYFRNNARIIEQATRNGLIWNGAEGTFDDARRGKVITRLINAIANVTPLGRFERGFNTALNVAGVENYKAIMGINSAGALNLARIERGLLGDALGKTDPEAAAALANKMTGRISLKDLGYSANARSFLSDLVLAPRYQAAFIGMLGDAVQGGMRGAEARRILGHLIGGSILTYVAAAKFTGQEPNLDPRNANFLRLKIGDNYYGLGGAWYPHLRAAADIVEAIQEGRPQEIDNILTRRARAISAPVVGLLVTQITGKDYFGNELDLRGRLAEAVPAPISLRTAIEEGPAAAAAQFLGGTTFPVSPWEQINDIARERYGVDYNALDLDQKQAIDQDPAVKQLFERMSESQRRQGSKEQAGRDQIGAFRQRNISEQEADDQRLRSGAITFDQWLDGYRARAKAMHDVSDQLSQAFGIEYGDKDVSKLPPMKAALDAYYAVDPDNYLDPATGKLTPEFFKAQEAALASLTPEQQRTVRAEIEKYNTPLVRDYKAWNRSRSAAYDEIERRGLNLEDPRDRAKLESDPELKALWDQARAPFAPAGASAPLTSGNLYADKVAQLERDQNVGAVARAALAGDPEALANWADIHSDIGLMKIGLGEGIFKDYPPETEVGKLVQEYYAVRLADYIDDQGNKDWDGYLKAQEAVLAKMPADLAAEIRKPGEWQDPDANRLDKMYVAARDLLRTAPAKYQGLEGDFADKYYDFAHKVNFYRPIIERETGQQVRPDDLARRLAKEMGDINLYEWYDALQSPTEREKLRNPAYDKFLGDHREQLQGFFPDLYGHAELNRLGILAPTPTLTTGRSATGIPHMGDAELGQLLGPGGVSGFIEGASAVSISPTAQPQTGTAAAPPAAATSAPLTRARAGPETTGIPLPARGFRNEEIRYQPAPKIGLGAQAHYTPETGNMTVYDPDTEQWHVFNFLRPTSEFNTLAPQQALELARRSGIDVSLPDENALVDETTTPGGEPPPALSGDLQVQYSPRERTLVVLDRGTGKRYYFNFEYPMNDTNTLTQTQAMSIWERYVGESGQPGTSPASPQPGPPRPVSGNAVVDEYDPDRQVLRAHDPLTGQAYYYNFRYPFSASNTLTREDAERLRDEYVSQYNNANLGILARAGR